MTKTTRFDAADYLDTEARQMAYIAAGLESGDADFMRDAVAPGCARTRHGRNCEIEAARARLNAWWSRWQKLGESATLIIAAFPTSMFCGHRMTN